MRISGRIEDDPLRLKSVVKRLGNSVAAHGSVPTAIYCFLRAVTEMAREPSPTGTLDVDVSSLGAGDRVCKDAQLALKDLNGFERALFYAICCGGDTDTIASMAGAIAGAYWGAEVMNESMISCCEGAEEAKASAAGLMALALTR